MIVVCTGCSAKFRVADDKVGPRGAKLRCSKCQTVFTVQQEIEVPSASGSAPAPEPAPVTATFTAGLRATPPPLPRRPTTLDARAVFDVDLEPTRSRPAIPFDPLAMADPFAPLPPEPPLREAPGGDPFGPPPVAAAPTEDPFGPSAPASPSDDPFGPPGSLSGESPPPSWPGSPTAAAGPTDFDPFSSSPAPPGDPLDGPGAHETAPPPPSGAGAFGSIFLEELTTPPARRLPRADLSGPAPMPMIAASEDPFSGSTAFDPGLSALDEGVLASAVPAGGSEARPPAPARPAEAEPEPPLQLDPFSAAAVAADPLAIGEPSRVAPPPPVETTAERKAADRSFRIRDVVVSAMALAALLLLSLAIIVVWRRELAPSEALRPSTILGALAPGPPAGALTATGVSSGLYERARGAPLLFVCGTVVSSSPTPQEGVTVQVEVVRDGAVLLRGEVPVGGVAGPEALSTAADAEELARALAEAAPAGAANLAPGASAPFLVAFAEYPANLRGASLRVRVVASR